MRFNEREGVGDGAVGVRRSAGKGGDISGMW